MKDPPTAAHADILPASSAVAVTGPYFVWYANTSAIPVILVTEQIPLKCQPATETPQDYFRLLLTDEIIDKIVTETYDFAQILMANNTSPKARITRWKQPLSKEEFLVFLGNFPYWDIPLSAVGRLVVTQGKGQIVTFTVLFQNYVP